MKTLQTRLSSLSKDRFLRNDEKYQEMVVHSTDNLFSTPTENNVPLSEVLQEEYTDFPYEDDLVYKGIPTGQAYIDEDGDIVDFQPVTIENHPGRLKYAVRNDNILLSSLRLAKSPALMFDDMDLSKHVFSNGFYIFKVREGWNSRFVLHLLRSKRIKRLIDNNLFRGIGISSYRVEDLLKCEVRKLSIDTQNDAVKRIEPIETKIRLLKKTSIKPQQIIDFLFERHFGFDYSRFHELKQIKSYARGITDFSNNPDLRFSAKFHRAAGSYVMGQLMQITDKRIKHFLSEPIVLGASISPGDYADDGEYYYISMATIKGWQFDSEGANTVSKAFSDSKADKTVRKNDIIFARSGEGTIGKVAFLDDENVQGVFADFTMRIRLKDYNPEFAYYYFRTSYFQYLVEVYKKGLGNNTNIFPIVIQEFPMIDISLDEQQRIVDEIHSEIAKQDEIKSKIAELRSQIDTIIEETIAGGNRENG